MTDSAVIVTLAICTHDVAPTAKIATCPNIADRAFGSVPTGAELIADTSPPAVDLDMHGKR